LTVVAFATGSRAPALFLVLLLMVFPLVSSLNRLSRRQSRSILLAGIAMFFLAIPLMRYAIDRELPFAMRFALILREDKGVSVRLREDDLATGLALARDNNWVGYGTGSWPILNGLGDVQAYPHNLFVEVLVEQGAVGLVVLLAFLGSVLFTAVRALRRVDDMAIAAMITVALSSFLYAVLVAQTSGDLYDNRYIWFYAGLVVTTSRLSFTTKATLPEGEPIAGTVDGLAPIGRGTA
jgi:O-antigen ligase